MAGLQSCFRGIIVRDHLRLLNKSGYVLYTNRGRHCLAFQLPLREKPHFVEKPKVFNTYLRYSIRLSSTNVPIQNELEKVIENVSPVTGNASTANDIVIDEASLPPIPTVEEPAQVVSELVSAGLIEPSFKSLGLGSYWPSGIIQQILEFLHINLDLTWWQAIMMVTLTMRVFVLPLNIKAKKNAVRLSNNMPEFQRLQMKLSEARETGNYYEVALYTLELKNFLQQKEVLAFSSYLPVFVQAPVFLSMYFALKGMTSLPVESLKTGGLFWFKDLTVPDPYYILPVVTCLTLFAIVKVGAEGTDMSMVNSPLMKYGLKVMPLIILPFIYNLPEAILWYWTVSNSVSLLQTLVLKIPSVAEALDIPKVIKHSPSTLPSKKKSILQGFKDGMNNLKIAKELEDRERVNSITFKDAGKAPIQRTFKKNPQLRKVQQLK